jgi:hypothetical protein
MSKTLTPYQGIATLGSTVSIRNTGDGLSHAMKVDPVELKIGSKVYVVLECEVEKHRHEAAIADAPTAGLTLVNMLKAGRATLVDAELVATALDEQTKRLEEAEGVQRLPGTDEADIAKKPSGMTDEEWEASAGQTDATITDLGEAKAKTRGGRPGKADK